MPLYSLRSRKEDGLDSVAEIGFYGDEGAVAYARRIAGSATVEVWRERELVAVVDRARVGPQPINAPIPA